jgi:hypothetical protein
VGLLMMNDYGDYRDELIGTPEGMGMFLVCFELINNGKAIEEAFAYATIEAIDLGEVFHLVQEDMAIEFQLRDFVNQNYGQLEFDAWKPKVIQMFVLDENGIAKRDTDPPVVWQDGDGEVIIN